VRVDYKQNAGADHHTFEIALGTAQDSSIRLTAGWALVGTPMMSTSLPLPTGLGYSFSE
jgi:hypothetical protein